MSQPSNWLKGSNPSETPGRHNPKIHGEIPNNPVGTTYKNREELCAAGVHAPLRAGIHGTHEDGAYSVVMSYGYEDDEDNGDTFIYTGHGGREVKLSPMKKLQGKESWDSEQAQDQRWILGNAALKRSCETGSPVRVVRGAPHKKVKDQKSLPFAPSTGYRYDGLYEVKEAWMEEGVKGFKVCRFRFERLPDELPLVLSAEANSLLTRRSSSSTSGSVAGSSKPAQSPVHFAPFKPSKEDWAKLGIIRKSEQGSALSSKGTPQPHIRPSGETEVSRTKNSAPSVTSSKSAIQIRKRSLSFLDSTEEEGYLNEGPVPTESPVESELSDSDWNWGGGKGKRALSALKFKKRKMDHEAGA